jgi:HPt (histidine-containing phosphotransfer) domain-containing protein
MSSAEAGSVLDAAAVRTLADLVGDEETLREIVDAFLDEGPQRIAELSAGLAAGDAVLVGRAAHTLKANSATFGAAELEGVARELESIARAGDLSGAAPLVAAATEQWSLVEAALRELRG